MPPIHDTPDPVTDGPPAHPPQVSPDAPHSAARALVGLLVVWGSFYLVALAQNYSYDIVNILPERGGVGLRQRSFLGSLDVRDRVMMPVESLTFYQKSAREMTRVLLGQAGFAVEERDVALLSEHRRNVSLSGEPYGRVLHGLIDDPSIGFALSGRRAQFFSQSLKKLEPVSGPLRQFEWRGIVDLSDAPTVIAPSPRSDLWAVFSWLPVPPPAPGAPVTRVGDTAEGRIGVEIWRGDRRLATGEGNFDRSGNISLNLSAEGSVLVRVEQYGRNHPANGNANRCRIRIFFRDESASARVGSV